MKQPLPPGAPRPGAGDSPAPSSSKKKVPTAQELISHYESQGLDSQESAVKVIEDLQGVLLRIIATKRKDKQAASQNASPKMALNTRLAVLEMKVDSKPGYAGVFGAGVASGLAVRGVETVVPHVVRAIGQIWSSVGSINRQTPHNP